MADTYSPIDADLEAIAREAAATHADSRGNPHTASSIRKGDGGHSDVLELARVVAYHTKLALLERTQPKTGDDN